MTHDEIEGMFLFTLPQHDGAVMAGDRFNGSDSTKWKYALHLLTVAEPCRSLIMAAPLMYQAITNQLVFISKLIESTDEQMAILRKIEPGIELPDLNAGYIAIQNQLMLAQSVARDGYEEVSRQITAQQSTGNKQ